MAIFAPWSLYPRERTPVPIELEDVWASELLWAFRRRDKCFLFQERRYKKNTWISCWKCSTYYIPLIYHVAWCV